MKTKIKLSDHWPTVTLDGKETMEQPKSTEAEKRASGSLKRMVGHDLLTGQPIYIDDDDETQPKCPSCGSRSLISDQPSITRCLKCGWNDD